MRLYMVRRTRTFILNHYAETDQTSGRKFLPGADRKYYFPVRVPSTIQFEASGQFADLHSLEVVETIAALELPRSDAQNALQRQFKSEITNKDLAKLVVGLHRENRLSLVQDDDKMGEEQYILCSLGLFETPTE
jgi:hypothetical protein